MGKTAILLGATGLTGGYLLELLLKTTHYESVLLFGRRNTGINHPKVKEHVTDLLKLDELGKLFKGEVVFCCIGTTQAKTKDRQTYRAIDYGIPVAASKLAAVNKIESFLVISSMGASQNSRIFYNKTKGEMERDVLKQDIPVIYVLRPSLIGGQRKEARLGEQTAKTLMRVFGFLVPKKYKMIHPKTIAEAMLKLAGTYDREAVIASHQIKEIASNG